MPNINTEFLNEIVQKINETQFSFSPGENPCFLMRWHPENKHLTHANIGTRIKKQNLAEIDPSSINQIISNVARKITKTFQSEMQQDLGNERVDLIVTEDKKNKGKKPDQESPYFITYNWLWDYKFPRYGWDFIWRIAQDDTTTAIDMLTKNEYEVDKQNQARLPRLDIIRQDNFKEIKVNEPYFLKVDFGEQHLPQNANLLLISKDQNNNFGLYCPSKAFSPQSQFNNNCKYLPDGEECLAPYVEYEEQGIEEFLAVIYNSQNPIQLSWIKPNYDSRDLILNETRLQEILTNLKTQGNPKVFYRSFRIV